MCCHCGQFIKIQQMGCNDSKNSPVMGHPVDYCPPDSWPALQPNYKPTGTTHQVNGLKIYEAGHGNRALVIFSDLYGIETGRHKAVADTFGALGYNVFMPEMLNPVFTGPLSDSAKMIEIVQQQKTATLEEKYEKLSKYLSQNNFKKFLVVGMSWGTWFSFKMSAKYDNIQAIVAIHPAFVVEKFYGGTQAKLFDDVKCPVLLEVCKGDNANIRPGGELLATLQRRFGSNAAVEEFLDMSHGWVAQGDVTDENVKRDTRKTIKVAYDYLNRFM